MKSSFKGKIIQMCFDIFLIILIAYNNRTDPVQNRFSDVIFQNQQNHVNRYQLRRVYGQVRLPGSCISPVPNISFLTNLRIKKLIF